MGLRFSVALDFRVVHTGWLVFSLAAVLAVSEPVQAGDCFGEPGCPDCQECKTLPDGTVTCVEKPNNCLATEHLEPCPPDPNEPDCCPGDPGGGGPGGCDVGGGTPCNPGYFCNMGTCVCMEPCPPPPCCCVCTNPTLDSDGDGTVDCEDKCPFDASKTEPGSCGCGVPDSAGCCPPDGKDTCPNDPDKDCPGQCGCGVPDTDSDGDGTADCHDRCPDDANKTEPGDCGCGVVDTPDCCDNGDCCPQDPNKTEPGQCGCGTPDTDSDGDNTADCNDGCPNDPNKTAPGICGCGKSDTEDSDGDGTVDCKDGCPDDPEKVIPQACGCGEPETDSDGDGSPDCVDGCPNDPNKTFPGQCGCGEVDTDTDGDGTADCNDGCPDDPNKTAPGACGCGVVDTPNCCDNGDCCPTDPNKTEPGQCGCGEPDTDTDGDGTADCNDGCPTDPNKTSPGQCGCGQPETCGPGGPPPPPPGGDECDPPIQITGVRLPNGFLAVPDIQIFSELGCVAPNQTTWNDIEITYRIKSDCSCSVGSALTYFELWYEGPFLRSSSGQCVSESTAGRQLASAVVPAPTSSLQTAVATFTITSTSDFTPMPAIVIDYGGGHFYLAVTADCGEAWYRIDAASCTPLIYNIAFSPAAHTGQPFCPYTHHHAGIPPGDPSLGWYGLELGYNLGASLDTDMQSGAKDIEVSITGSGMAGVKSIHFTTPMGSLSNARNYVKWEGYDSTVTEESPGLCNSACADGSLRGSMVESPQDLVQHVVSEGTYFYAISAGSRDDTHLDLWMRHWISNLPVEVRYNLMDVSIECPHP